MQSDSISTENWNQRMIASRSLHCRFNWCWILYIFVEHWDRGIMRKNSNWDVIKLEALIMPYFEFILLIMIYLRSRIKTHTNQICFHQINIGPSEWLLTFITLSLAHNYMKLIRLQEWEFLDFLKIMKHWPFYTLL